MAETDPLRSEFNVPLVPNLPDFTHKTLSLMLEGLEQQPQVPIFAEQTEKQPREEVKQSASFFSLGYKLCKQIWILALEHPPRIIVLTKSTTYAIHSRAVVPALLHTCRESREIAKRYYSLSFATQDTSPKVYFDFHHDWLYTQCGGCLGMDCNHKFTLTEDHKKVKHLIYHGPMSHNPFPKILRFYPKIENLILIGGRGNAQRSDINKADISIVHEKFSWALEDDLLTLARKAWRDLKPTGGRMSLKHIWRGALPDLVNNVKRGCNPKKGLWTCCT